MLVCHNFFFDFAITRNLVLLTSIFFKKSSIFRCFLMKLVLNSFVVLFILLKNEIVSLTQKKSETFIVYLHQIIILQNISSRIDGKQKEKLILIIVFSDSKFILLVQSFNICSHNIFLDPSLSIYYDKSILILINKVLF